jgi:pimeloyl-ACP methyl ester carboxylesterase
MRADLMQTVVIQGIGLEYARLAPAQRREGSPPIVFLHEGLGSVSLWRDFPQRVADACGAPAVVYSRQGHGSSAPSTSPRTRWYLHHEALEVLPLLIDRLELERPLLFGHSDGATIALLCAGETSTPLAGVVALAPHVLVEEITTTGIRQTVEAWRNTDLRQRLARHHSAQNLDAVFAAWHGTWLDPAFGDWNAETCLPHIRCPVLAMQGVDDEYATMAQFDRIVGQVRDVTALRLASCGHSPHRDQAEAVVAATSAFLK